MRCEREKDVKALLRSGHWPEASGADLREHVAACAKCGDVVLLEQAFRGARAETMKAAPAMGLTATPGVIWWRAQVRRRQQALEQIARPMWGAQVFAFAVALVLGLGLAGFEVERGMSWQEGARALHLEALLPAGGLMLLALCVGVVAVLGGVVVYLGVERR